MIFFFQLFLVYRDDELLKRAGSDGLLYVSFQRHLIILTGMMTLSSLFVILPINYSGEMLKNDAFSQTTLLNLAANSGWLWVHTLVLLSYLPVGAYVMRKFIKKVIIQTLRFLFIYFEIFR